MANSIDEILFVPHKKRTHRSGIQKFGATLKEGWKCSGVTGDYELWDKADPSSTWVFTTLTEMRDYCREEGLLT
tara:strand:+ start:392 stop:613 length:222 start_codon:yes stop_codon:yes gene_type:complete